MNPEELLRQANAAIRRGADPAAVSARVRELTDGRIPDLAALGEAVRAMPREEAPKEAASRRLAARGGNALGDFLRMAAQGTTFGLADEIVGLGAGLIPGGQTREEATAASRQRVEDLRTLAPGASLLSEIAGGVAIPFAGAAGIAGRLTRPGAGVLGRAAAGAGAGALAGAAGGGLFGLGEAEGDLAERLPEAARGAGAGLLAGGLLGGVLPAVGAGLGKAGRFGAEIVAPESSARREAGRRLRRVFAEADVPAAEVPARLQALGPEAVVADLDPRLAREARNALNQAATLERAGGPVARIAERAEARGERLARALRQTSGITETMEGGQRLAERAVQEVREQHYRPLEQAFRQVDGPNVEVALQEPRIAAVARKVVPDLEGEPRPPSFTELQDIMLDLRDEVTAARAAGRPNASQRASEALDVLTDAMERDIPGFAEAQNAFRLASKRLEGYQRGFQAWQGSARQIREAMAELPPEAHDAFRVGLIQRWEEKLLTKEGTSAPVSSILRAGSDMREQIRAAFGSEEGFRAFLRQRDIERTFRATEAALSGNSSTAKQAADAIDAAPMSKSDLLNRIWDAVLSPGESRRMQAEQVGEALLGRNLDELLRILRPSPIGVGVPGAGGGSAGALGALTGGGLLP